MYNLKKTFMKHFNKLFALTAAFIATFFAAGNAFAQDDAGKDGNYYYDPAETPAGYYYLIGGWNENRALHVEEGKLWVTDFDQEDVSFIFYVTGQDKSKEENKGKLIKDLGNGKRLYIYAGDPTNEKAIGGPLGSNGAVPLTTNAGGGGLYGSGYFAPQRRTNAHNGIGGLNHRIRSAVIFKLNSIAARNLQFNFINFYCRCRAQQ